MKNKNLVLSALALALVSFEARALDNIIRPMWTARTAGMGGVRYTTGLYEENFFGNPARVTANPKWRVTLIDPSFEINSGIKDNASKLTGSGDTLSKIGSTSGTNNHFRYQMTPLAFYVPVGKKPEPKAIGKAATDTIRTTAAAEETPAAATKAADKAASAAESSKATATDAAKSADEAAAKAKDDAAGAAKALTAGVESASGPQVTAPEVVPPVVTEVVSSSERKWAFAVTLLTTSVQTDIDIRNNWHIDPQMVADVGPAITFGHKFMADDALSVGTTVHAHYRLATRPDMSLSDVLNDSNIILPTKSGGERFALDFDLGGTYVLPWTPMEGLVLSSAAAINNIAGGKIELMKKTLFKDTTGAQPETPRTLSLGVNAMYADWKVLHNSMLALEITDIGNNTNGGIFRLLHIGAETHLSLLALRLGINQGYLCAGVGLDLKLLTIDAATYGEEMSLNPGGLEDRRYALKVGIQL